MTYYDYLCRLLEPMRVYRTERGTLSGGELYAAGKALDEADGAMEYAEQEGVLQTAEGEGLARREKLFSRCPVSVSTALRREAIALDLVGLADKAKEKPMNLSGGEQQRVAIARALVNNPRLIIADEPTGNLDPARSLELMTLFEKINELGTTVLIVTHEKGLVDEFEKRVVVIDNGEVISDQTGGYYQI